MTFSRLRRRAFVLLTVALLALFAGLTHGLLGVCGPFTDTPSDPFCVFILEVFYMGITTGTTPTTYDPTGNVNRTQMAAFLSRTVDRTLQRGSRRAVLDQFWTPQNSGILGVTPVGGGPQLVRSDGLDVWVANIGGTVSRVRAGDGRLLETWTGAASASGTVIAMGLVLVTGQTSPGRLYAINPTQAAGSVTTVASTLGNNAGAIAFDGARFWVADFPNAISIITPGSLPWTVTTVTTGFIGPVGALYDGANVWMTDQGAGTLLKLDGSGAIIQTVSTGSFPQHPVFDGTNIWVPNSVSGSVAVVRDSSGAVLTTLTGNGLVHPHSAAFDGQRVLVTNYDGNSVSLWKAADLSPLGSISTGAATTPLGACSDGVNFWITLFGSAELARF
ncbi:MAG TPA: hypothetical protein VKG01_08610 [Thermoanaerobaculia bacterium]|nr:hypothetical protein [Thermoanaerobaculia bacterium]